MEAIAERQTLIAQQDVNYMMIFILTTLERNKRGYDAKNKPDNNELTAHMHKYQQEFDKDIEVLILKGNLHQKHER